MTSEYNSYTWYFHFLPKVDIPEQVSNDGRFAIEHFEVDEEAAKFFNLQQAINGNPERGIAPGEYTKLVDRLNGEIVMSDTPAEAMDNMWLYNRAEGRVLINGLGLGFVLNGILNKRGIDNEPAVEHVTVVEKYGEIISMVAPHVVDQDRVEIIEADALVWRPEKGARFDVVWHDIWNHISEDNRDDITKLHRSYGQRASHQNSWSRDYLDRWRREDYQARGWR